MIESFASTETEHLFTTGKSRRLPPDILRRAVMRLTQLDAATALEDLRLPPSNRLEALSGDRAGQWSIRINGQWRAFVSNAATRKTLKSWITTEEKSPADHPTQQPARPHPTPANFCAKRWTSWV